MAIPHFFSVERQGYTKISDLFCDVLNDMLTNGFTKVNISHGLSGVDLRTWKTTVSNIGASRAVGDKFYIQSGTRPTSPGGVLRPAPYVIVNSVQTNTGISVIPKVSGSVASFSDVRASYDNDIWVVPPTNPVELWTDPTGGTKTNTTINISNVLISRASTGVISNAPDSFSFTVEAGPSVDPLNGSTDPNTGGSLAEADRQPWRVQFVVTDEQKVSGSVATHLQMYYDAELGRITISKITDDDGDIIDNVGVIGGVQVKGEFSDNDINQGFYNRKVRVADQPQTFPLSYLLTITDRGFFLGIWEGSWSTIRGGNSNKSNYFNWVLVQRPVDRATGKTLTNGKAPVFHLNSVNYRYYKTIVRESDVLHPTSGPSPKPTKGQIHINGIFSTNPDDWWIESNINTVTQAIDDFGDIDVWKENTYIYDNVGTVIGKLKAFYGNGSMYGNTGYQVPGISGNIFTSRANLSSRPVAPYGFPDNPTVSSTWATYYIASTLSNNLPVPTTQTIPIDFTYTDPNVLAYRVLADQHSPDSHMIFNGVEQVALTEDKTYLLSFPHNLTTPRFRYTEELDLIGCTSSDVVMAGQDIQFTTYGEWGPRTYRALPSNSPLNTGFRISALIAPMGPKWVTAAGQLSQGAKNTFTPGDVVNIQLSATKIPDAARGRVTFDVVRGSLPTGITLVDDTVNFRLTGTLGEMDYTQQTDIKFTIAARNAAADGDGGYALRDFYITYVPL